MTMGIIIVAATTMAGIRKAMMADMAIAIKAAKMIRVKTIS